jgi:hypothetical protein
MVGGPTKGEQICPFPPPALIHAVSDSLVLGVCAQGRGSGRCR